jgi:hypothetical protein
LDYGENEDAQRAFERLTDGGSRSPSSHELVSELGNPGSEVDAECGVAEIEPTDNTRRPAQVFRSGSQEYNIQSNAQREALIQEIIDAGPRGLGTTRVRLSDGNLYEVMNDNVTLSDGTYVPLTFPEAQRMARAWDYQLPSASQAVDIGRIAASSGNQFLAITRSPNNGPASQRSSMNAMMNDSRMRERARAGQDELIDGHFKWYTNDGRIYGFARGGGRFWQNRPSGAHVGDPGYYDYSHGVRMLRRVQ